MINQTDDKLRAVAKLRERFSRLINSMSEPESDLADAMLCELELRACGEWLTALDKHLRVTERKLGISRKGNKSINIGRQNDRRGV